MKPCTSGHGPEREVGGSRARGGRARAVWRRYARTHAPYMSCGPPRASPLDVRGAGSQLGSLEWLCVRTGIDRRCTSLHSLSRRPVAVAAPSTSPRRRSDCTMWSKRQLTSEYRGGYRDKPPEPSRSPPSPFIENRRPRCFLTHPPDRCTAIFRVVVVSLHALRRVNRLFWPMLHPSTRRIAVR